MTPITVERREQFQLFIEQVLAPETAVKGVVGIGSIATGHMTPTSDVDAVIFLDPYDPYIVPAEAIWRAEDNSFHSIFTDVEGLQLDFYRLDWQQWRDPEFEWPEGRRAELSAGWIAYDPTGETAVLIARRTTYDDAYRLAQMDEAIVWLDQHLHEERPQQVWDALGPTIAFDRLEAAYYYLVQALFAYNRRWRVWRNREMQTLLRLPWLPDQFVERVLIAGNAPALDEAGFKARADALRALFTDFLEQAVANGDYSPTPIDQAFMRLHEEPGRAWNLAEWQKFHVARSLPRQENGRN